jgi:phage protein U
MFKDEMGNGTCATAFSFSFTGNSNAYFIAIVANGSTFGWFFLQLVNERLNFLFNRGEFLLQAFSLPFKNRNGFNIIGH